jgi:pimeloyl-ACP methyl ester carboxylesterase
VKAEASGTSEDSDEEDDGALAAVFTGGSFRHLLKDRALATAMAAKTGKEAAKKGGGVAAVAIVLALGGGAFGVVSDIFDKDTEVADITPIEVAAGELHGTLLMPKKNSPIVLIVPGSGPTNRDGNSPLGVKAQPYKLLAEALAEEGIATVRVDKRGMFGSAAAGDPNAVTVEQYAQDYRAWIDSLRAQTGRDCIFLLGHSEGALMVSAAAEGRKDVCGLILVSGMGRKLGDVLRAQLQANPANAPLLDQALPAIAELEAGRRVDTSAMNPALLSLFAPQVQDYLVSLMAADPVETLRKADQESLIVQGTTDLQTTVADARLLNKARNTDLYLPKGMNHILKEAPEDRAANLATYMDPDLPIYPDLAPRIKKFVRKND